jgi:hypothetical protein
MTDERAQTTQNQSLDLSPHLLQGANEVTIVQSAPLADYVFVVRFHASSVSPADSSWDAFLESTHRPFALPIVSCDSFRHRFVSLPFLPPP